MASEPSRRSVASGSFCSKAQMQTRPAAHPETSRPRSPPSPSHSKAPTSASCPRTRTNRESRDFFISFTFVILSTSGDDSSVFDFSLYHGVGGVCSTPTSPETKPSASVHPSPATLWESTRWTGSLLHVHFS